MTRLKIKRLIILFLLNLVVQITNAQKETNVWYFGENAGLDFKNGTPFPLYNGQLNTYEGCSTISDTAGNLLFYTDGMKVWNKNHIQMPNGVGLKGGGSSTQSALIVQKPGKQSTYYIFTTNELPNSLGEGAPQRLCYSEIDMTLQNGTGDVIVKNTFLHTPSCEKLAGIRHCNGNDVWVVTHDWASDTFRTFLVDSFGVNPNPVLSSAGLIATGKAGNSIGQLKGSPDGKKLASALERNTARFELFDFDNTTGQVSNQILFAKYSLACYAVEFSPDGTKMYGITAEPNAIYQFDLKAGSDSAIAASGKVVGSSNSALFGSLQLGPDKRIYVARAAQKWLGVINNPNEKGSDCNYIETGVSLERNSFYGLPNFINSYAKPVLLPFTATVNCLQVSFSCQKNDGCSQVISADWNFGDPQSGDNYASSICPLHLFSKSGLYDVTVELHYKCKTDILKQRVLVPAKVFSTTISGLNAFCVDKRPVLTGSVIGKYSWNTGETRDTILALPFTKDYSVAITTSAGCTYTASKTITVHPLPVVTANGYTLGELTSRLAATGGVMYNWSPSDGLSCNVCQSPIANYPGTTTYCVKVTDDKGCTNTACVEVPVSSAYVPNTFTPNDDNLNDVFMPIVREVHDYHLMVFDRWGKKIFESADPVKGWNGKYKDELCDEDVYAFRFTYIDDIRNQEHQHSGKVTLIR